MTELLDRLRGPAPSIPAMRDAAREIETLERHNRAFRDANASLDKKVHELRDLMHQLGAAAVLVSDGIEDEGGRCVFGSTNHAEVLREAKQSYDEYRFETGDMGAEDALADNTD